MTIELDIYKIVGLLVAFAAAVIAVERIRGRQDTQHEVLSAKEGMGATVAALKDKNVEEVKHASVASSNQLTEIRIEMARKEEQMAALLKNVDTLTTRVENAITETKHTKNYVDDRINACDVKGHQYFSNHDEAMNALSQRLSKLETENREYQTQQTHINSLLNSIVGDGDRIKQLLKDMISQQQKIGK